MILGNDVSKWQGTINFDIYKNNTNFVLFKATEGYSYLDPQFKRNQSEARRVKLLCGYYHFARPDLAGNTPEKEAAWFLAQVGQLQEGEMLVLDYEPEIQVQAHVDWCKRWLDIVYQLTGVKALIYLNQTQVRKFNWQSVIDAGHGLWIAAYTYDPNNNNYEDGQWPFAAMQQWTNKQQVPGIPAVADGNVFFGNESQFKSYGYKTPSSPSQSPSPSASGSPSPSNSPSPSHSPSPSSSPSRSPSASPSPSMGIPDDPDHEKLIQVMSIVSSQWSGWFFSPNYWKIKLQKLRDILYG